MQRVKRSGLALAAALTLVSVRHAGEVEKIRAGDATMGDTFGGAICVWGDTLLVGASADDHPGVGNAGSVYVYVRVGTSWLGQAKLTASDAAANDNFGRSVALFGETAVIGAPGVDGAEGNTGAAYVFVRSGATWSEQAKLAAAGLDANDGFGGSVALRADEALIGAPSYDAGLTTGGAVFRFERTGTAWTETQTLTSSDTENGDQFGFSIDLDTDTAVIGARADDDVVGTFSGAAYVFVDDGSSWSEQAKLTADDVRTNEEFGFDVAVHGDTAVIGAPRYNEAFLFSREGAAYVFERTGTTWALDQKLQTSDMAVDDYLGTSVAIEGGSVLLGAFRDTHSGFDEPGSAYLFARDLGGWAEVRKLTASDPDDLDLFGAEVSFAGDMALIGVPGDDHNPIKTNAGSVYAFLLCDAPSTYCTAGTTANGCLAEIGGVGTPSAAAAGGFDIVVTAVEGQKQGIVFYGITGPAASPWGAGSSFLCVKSPTQRTGAQGSGGTAGACDGTFTVDWNAYVSSNPTALGNPFLVGDDVWAQSWFRDPPSPKTTSLSNGLHFTVCP